MTNNYKWDLSKLYTGYDDPIFLKDYDQLVNYKNRKRDHKHFL